MKKWYFALIIAILAIIITPVTIFAATQGLRTLDYDIGAGHSIYSDTFNIPSDTQEFTLRASYLKPYTDESTPYYIKVEPQKKGLFGVYTTMYEAKKVSPALNNIYKYSFGGGKGDYRYKVSTYAVDAKGRVNISYYY
ncbi:MAG TPA: hypothetical protein DCY94_00005 [Firmicutes bacterium]|nr:hypothetical protein [Bacillota bacterium]